MKIKELLKKDGVTVSFEVFPPKSEANYESIYNAAMNVAALKPSYMSVTYGAGGSTSKSTVAIAGDIQKKYDVCTIAHLTCACADKENIHSAIDEMKENPEGLIFYDYNKKRKGSQYRKGGIVETTQVNSFFKRICAKAGITGMGQHSLRHTFATRCIEAGVQPVVLKTWMGHTDIHITLDTYADVFNHLNDSSQVKLEDYLTGNEKRRPTSWRNS